MPPIAPHPSGYLSSARLLAVLTLLSRILGLARDVCMARVFGAGKLHDAFVLAFTIPNLFRRLFGEGALSAAFIPVFARTIEAEGEARAKRILANVAFAVGAFLVATAGLGAVAALATRAAWVTEARVRLALLLVAVLLPYLVSICLVALLGGALNTIGRFAETGISPATFNLYWLAGLYVVVPFAGGATEGGIVALAWVLVAAGFLQLGGMLWPLWRRGWLVRPRDVRADPALAEIGRAMAPMLFGIAIFQLNVLVDRLIAWWLVEREGAVSVLYLGNRVMQFPLGIVGVAMGTAAFPLLARLAASDASKERYREVLAEAMGVTLFLAVPASLGLVAIRTPFVELFFSGRAFTAEDGARMGAVLAVYGLSIWAACLSNLVTRALYSQHEQRAPVRIGVWMVVLNVVLNLALVFPLQEVGLALATTLVSVATVAWQLVALDRVLARRGHPRLAWRGLLRSLARTTGLALGMCGIVWGTLALLEGHPLWERFAYPLAAGTVAYAALARVFEPAMLRAVLRRG